MKIFHHNDLDGRLAAFYVWETSRAKQPVLVEMNYDKDFPIDTIKPDEEIWIVDFSIEPYMMRSLLDITDNVTWIDHHKTAIEKYNNFNTAIKGDRNNGECGAMLTFKYLHGNTCPERVLNIVDTWDCWKEDSVYFPDAQRFSAGSKQFDTRDMYFWERCVNNKVFVDEVIKLGQILLENQRAFGKELFEQIGTFVELDGYKGVAFNQALCNSTWFDHIPIGYDFMSPFYFNLKTNKFVVSLYSQTIDVSTMAKKRGGGGHRGASGFVCDTLPYTKEATNEA